MTVDEILRGAAADLTAQVRSEVDVEAALDRLEAAPGRSRRPLVAVAAAVLVALALAAVVATATAGDGDDDADDVAVATTTSVPLEVAGPAPGVSEGLVITATPADGLVDDQEVRLVIEDVPDEEGLFVELAMCAGDVMAVAPLEGQSPDVDRCESSGELGEVVVGDGRAEATFPVDQVLNVGMDDPIDCARRAVRCAVGVFFNRGVPEGSGQEPLGPQLVGIVGVGFAPVGPPPELDVGVAPATGLEHGQVVTVEGEGFEGSVRGASLCPPSTEVDRCLPLAWEGDSPGDDLPTEDGRFSAEVAVWRTFPGPDGPVDCAEVACTLVVAAEDGRTSPPVPLRFAGGPPPGALDLEVTPTTGLRPGYPVAVTVRGLVPGGEVWVEACLLDAAGDCSFGMTLELLTADDEGVAMATVPAIDPAQYGQTCIEAGACGVSLSRPIDGGDPRLWDVRPVPVRFAPP